ncbi:MAG: hypothetical protein PVI43_01755 [Candidatus Bathyarchaeota archaeon]|jgi:hypothetical protein
MTEKQKKIIDGMDAYALKKQISVTNNEEIREYCYKRLERYSQSAMVEMSEVKPGELG